MRQIGEQPVAVAVHSSFVEARQQQSLARESRI
jgi:hypothetical protein